MWPKPINAFTSSSQSCCNLQPRNARDGQQSQTPPRGLRATAVPGSLRDTITFILWIKGTHTSVCIDLHNAAIAHAQVPVVPLPLRGPIDLFRGEWTRPWVTSD